ERLADALPPRGWSRRAPATLADRRRRVRDAEPGRATVAIDESHDLAAGGRASQRGIRHPGRRRLGATTPEQQPERQDEGDPHVARIVCPRRVWKARQAGEGSSVRGTYAAPRR